MSRVASRSPTRYVAPESLAYSASLWPYEPGARLTFDESYRLGHLPLVAPDHPAVIRSVQHLDYASGRYDARRISLILPVDADALAASATFQDIQRDLAARSLGGKVAWELSRRRASRLHATLVPGIAEEDLAGVAARVAEVMETYGPLRYRLGGPFVGTRNRGRIYFTVFPEWIGDGDVFSLLQEALGVPRTRFYVVGYYNLTDELTGEESADLAAFLATWADATVAELTAPSLTLLATHDDLALESEVLASIG